MVDSLRAIVSYLLLLTLVLGGVGVGVTYAVNRLPVSAQALEAREPAVAPRIAAWRERNAEAARFEQARQEAAAREQQARSQPVAVEQPAPRARIVERRDMRREELSARRRGSDSPPMPSEELAVQPRQAPTYIGGLTATHSETRDRSGN